MTWPSPYSSFSAGPKAMLENKARSQWGNYLTFSTCSFIYRALNLVLVFHPPSLLEDPMFQILPYSLKSLILAVRINKRRNKAFSCVNIHHHTCLFYVLYVNYSPTLMIEPPVTWVPKEALSPHDCF